MRNMNIFKNLYNEVTDMSKEMKVKMIKRLKNRNIKPVPMNRMPKVAATVGLAGLSVSSFLTGCNAPANKDVNVIPEGSDNIVVEAETTTEAPTEAPTASTVYKGEWVKEEVVIKEAYDEKVLVKEAWDEKVKTGTEKVLVKAAWDEQVKERVKTGTEKVLVKAAWDEQKQVLVKEAWDEQVLVKEAWDEQKQVLVSEEWRERIIVGYEPIVTEAGSISTRTLYDYITHPAEYKTETIHHDAEYTTIHHDAEYKTETVHHDAEYKDVDRYDEVTKTVHHDAEYKDVDAYKNVHHEAEYKTVHHEAETKEMEVWYDEKGFRTNTVREIGSTEELNLEDITEAAPENTVSYNLSQAVDMLLSRMDVQSQNPETYMDRPNIPVQGERYTLDII